MKCPTCAEQTAYNGNPFRPFCSERCKLLDLGKWASESFRVPTLERPLQELGSSGDDEDV